MKVINGVKTNLGGNYSFNDGNGTKTGTLCVKHDCRESDEEMFERLSSYGYKRITFYHTTTSVRGYYSTIAMCY